MQLAQDSFDLEGGESTLTSLQVLIPAGAMQGEADSFILRATSSHDPSKWDELEFTTTVSQGCTAVADLAFTWSPADPWVGDELTFAASATGSTPLTYTWDFGDGDTATGEQVLHLYAAGGSDTVTLEASNACSLESLSQSVTVIEGVQLYLPVISKSP